MEDKTLHILLVEDNPGDARLLEATLAGAGTTIVQAGSLAGALERLEQSEVSKRDASPLENPPAAYDVILLDLSLPDSRGLETVARVQQSAPDVAIVVLTGSDDEQLGLDAVRLGAQDYLVKGRADQRLLRRAIRYGLERKDAQRENQRLIEALRKARAGLEKRVQERTADLAGTVEELQGEVRDRIGAQEALRESEQRYRSLVELSPDVVNVLGGGRIIYANRASLAFYGVGRVEDLVGRRLADFAPKGQAAPLTGALKAALKDGSVLLKDVRLVRADGRALDVEGSAARITYGAKPAVLAVMRDVTERKAAERRAEVIKVLLEQFAAQRTRQGYLRAVTEVIRDWSGCRCAGIRVLDREGRIPYEAYAGFSREFWEKENWLSLSADTCACVRVINGQPEPQDLPALTPNGSFRCDDAAAFAGSLSPEQRGRFRGQCIKAGFRSLAVIPIRCRRLGSPEARDWSLGPQVLGAIHLADEREGKTSLETVQFLETVAALIGQATERFTMEQEHRRLEAQVLAVSEMERQRIGQDLHDSLGQSLTGIAFMTSALQRKLAERKLSEAEDAAQIERLVNESVSLTRALSRGLSPVGLSADSFLNGLKELSKGVEEVYGIACPFRHDSARIEDSLVATHLYRIAQEAVNNAVKHAKAREILLELACRGDMISLSVQDDGLGLGRPGAAPRGMGLQIMKYRAAAIGALLEIKPAPRGGTAVVCLLPKSPV